jgi:class 3 adenylate cyclase/tetratricopeptide (TPR) repeat protein
MSTSVSAGPGEEAVEGRRRHVTVLFADLCDYTSLNETSDPEDTDDLRRQVEALATRVITKHGGVVSQVYGDGVLAVFGFPVPQEDDARRAIEAAIDLHEATRSAQWEGSQTPAFEVRMHSGVHAGLVFAREGDALHGRYELTGDTVNTAARLCGAAVRDQILVSSAALHGIEAFFDTEPALELALKGKRAKVSVRRVTGRSDVLTRFEASTRRGLTTFVGRKPELCQLTDLLDQSFHGFGQIVVVCGAPGIGKSRLLEEFGTQAAESATVLRGSCEGYGGMAPLQPFLQALRGLFAIRPTTRVEDAERAIAVQLKNLGGQMQRHMPTFLQLLSLRPSTVDNAFGAAELLVESAVTELLRALSERLLLLLILDDWQWADDLSRKVLDSIVRDSQTRPICIVVGTRGSERPDPILDRAITLHLVPFGEAESSVVIRALRPRALDLGVGRAIHLRSGGNPLFLEELCRSLPDDDCGDEHMFEHGGVPSTIQGVIQTRVAALPPVQAHTLRVASVIGSEFTASQLADVLRDGEIDSALEGLCQADLVHSRELKTSFRFKHGITREVIYDSVRIAERRAIHQTIARAIERSVATASLADQSEALAYHYRGAGDHDRAAHYAELAGNKAIAASALDRARFQYASALAALDKSPPSIELKGRWVGISTKWAGACAYSPARNQLDSLARAAAYARELGDNAAEAQVEYALGWIRYALGDHCEPVAHYRRALELAEAAGNEKFVAQLWANLGQSHAAARDYQAALAFLTRSIESKRARTASQRVVAQGSVTRLVAGAASAYALACRASVHADLGDFEHADSDIGEALALVQDTGHPMEGSVRALHAMIEIYRGRWGACIEAAARSRTIAERVDSAYVFATSSAFGAYARFMTGGSDAALQELQRAVDWLETRDIRLFISFSYGCLADALVTTGDLEGARGLAMRALSRAGCHDPLGETMAYRALAQLHAAEGRRSEAADCLRSAMQAANTRGSQRDAAMTRLLEAELGVMTGAGRGLEAIRDAAQSALGDFELRSMLWHAERARRVLAKLKA